MRVRALIALLAVSLAVSMYGQAPQPRSEVSGRILDPSSQPVAGIMVELHSWSGGLLGTQMTNAAGEFDFVVQAGGPFEIRVQNTGQTESLPLQGDDLTNVDIKLPGPPRPAATASQTVAVNDLEAPAKAKSKLAAAERAINKLDMAKAWSLVNEAVAAAPNWSRAHLLRGVLSLDNHNYASARTDLVAAVNQNPRNALALTELGKLYSTTGQYQLSALYLQRALNIAPVLWPTYFEMAALDLKRGNFAEAEQMADYAEFATPPAPPAAHYLAAEAAYGLHDYKTAEIEFRSFLALTPPTPEQEPAIAAARAKLATMPHPGSR